MMFVGVGCVHTPPEAFRWEGRGEEAGGDRRPALAESERGGGGRRGPARRSAISSVILVVPRRLHLCGGKKIAPV